MQRRSLIIGAGLGLTGLGRRAFGAGAAVNAGLPEGTREEAVLEALPGKRKLIKLSYRPPNYETPLADLGTPFTANDAFFVRYHLSQIPDMAALQDWRLRIGGEGAGKPVELTFAMLAAMPAQEVVAVCQCSGNRRGLSNPHVPGVQWGVGAMGNATWRGPRLRDVLALAGVKKEAVEIAYHGPDHGPIETTPIFAKSIPVAKALEDEPIIALAMNGEALPLWNGFPARIVVPGWTATYWMKHVTDIDIRTAPLTSFWMKAAYRVPAGMFPGTPFPGQDNEQTRPITDILVNSLATSHASGDGVAAAGFTVAGQAWDGGSGIAKVEISTDAGASWVAATLGGETGRFGFRPWSAALKAAPGPVAVRIRATSRAGAVQPEKPSFNPAGYHNNAIQTLTLTAS